MATPTDLIYFVPGEQLTAALMNQLQTLFITNVSATPLQLVGAGTQLTVLGNATVGSLTVTGSSSAPTPASGDNSSTIATTAYVTNAVGTGGGGGNFNGANAIITGGSINGTPIGLSNPASAVFSSLTAPTALPGTNNSQVATTAFVAGQAATSLPLSDTDGGAVGTSIYFARQDHVHPISTLNLTSGTINGMTIGLITPAAAKFSSITNTGAQINSVRVVTSGGNITQLLTDRFIILNKTAGQPTNVTLIANPSIGQMIGIKDARGDASVNIITITPASGLIDGQTSAAITIAFGSIDLVFNGVTGWSIVDEILPATGGTSTSGIATGSAFGSSLDAALSVWKSSATGLAVGFSQALARSSGSLIPMSGDGAATGSSDGAGVIVAQGNMVGSATGGAQAFAVTGAGNLGVGAATGTSTDAATGSSQNRTAGAASSTGTASAATVTAYQTVGSATGTGTAFATPQTNTETVEGFILTLPGQTIYASTIVGSASTGTVNSFSITSYGGQVTFNTVTDTSTSNVVELVYHNHQVFYENTSGSWFGWVSSGSWTSVASPVFVATTESAEGTIVTTTAQAIHASTTTGSAAAIAGPFDSWTLTANPGQVRQNGILLGSLTNITQIYYHNNTVFVLSGGSWYAWTGESGGIGGSFGSPVSSPVPTTAAINIAPQTSEQTNATFIVSGTLQGYGSGGSGTINLLRDSSMVNAAAGTPGILPQFWSATLNGATQAVVGSGTDATTGYPYIDITFGGTPSALNLYFDSQIAVSANTAYTLSMYVAMVGGSQTNMPGFTISNDEYAGSTQQTDQADNNALKTVTLTSTPTLYSLTTTTQGTTTQVLPFIQLTVGSVMVTTTNGLSVKDTANYTYTMDSAGNMYANGVMVNGSGGTLQCTSVSGVIWAQDAASLTWYTYTGGGATGTFAAQAGSPPQPSINITLRLAGVQLQQGSAVLAFQPTPVTSLPPTLNYEDDSTNVWNAFPSTTNVTTTTWSFVHPPITSANAGLTLAVRDANNNAVTKTSNSFQVYVPGVTTLTSITTSPAGPSITVGNPVSGALVCTVTVGVTPGSFSGTLSLTGTNASSFTVSQVAGVWQVQTAAILAAGTYNFNIVATQAGATGSPLSTSRACVISAESAAGASLTSAAGTIVGSSSVGVAGAQLTWALVSVTNPFAVVLNGITQTGASAGHFVTQLAYFGHTLFMATQNPPTTGTINWSYYNGTTISGGQTVASNFTSCASPIQTFTLSSTTFAPTTSATPAASGITITFVVGGVNAPVLSLGGTNGANFQINSPSTSVSGNVTTTTAALWTKAVMAANTYSISVSATV